MISKIRLFTLFTILIASCTQKDKPSDKLKFENTEKNKTEVDTLEILKTNRYVGDYLFASKEILNSSDFDHISCEELRIIRNEIFARYGYIFKDEQLTKHFSSKEWYLPLYKRVDSLLNKIEIENIAKLKDAEKNCQVFSNAEQLAFYIENISGEMGFERGHKILSYKFGETVFPPFNEVVYADRVVFPNSRIRKFILFKVTSMIESNTESLKNYSSIIKSLDKNGKEIETMSFSVFADFTQTDGLTLKCVEHEEGETTITFIGLDENENLVKKYVE